MCKLTTSIPDPVIHIDHEAAAHLGRLQNDMVKLSSDDTTDFIAFCAKMVRHRDPSRGHNLITKISIHREISSALIYQ